MELEILIMTPEVIREKLFSGERVFDEDVSPYLAKDAKGREYWFSPVLGEAVVISNKEGIC